MKARGKLTEYGRRVLIDRVVKQGYPVAHAAQLQGISAGCAYRWLRRWRAEGEAGLADRSCRPHRSPRRLDAETEQRVIALRTATKLGPHQLAARLGMPRSTVYAVLRRHGLNRLAVLDRPTGSPVRYQRDHPGELVHVDVTKLGRVPDGGGWRAHGRGQDRHHGRSGVGYDYLHVAVDDRTRLAYVEVHPDERGDTCAGFVARAGGWFAQHGVRVERVLTDNAMSYRKSRAFADALADLGAAHRRTRPYRPQTNGKVERFHQTLTREWAYTHPYGSNAERITALDLWLHHYNTNRPHSALEGATPMHTLQNHVCGKHN